MKLRSGLDILLDCVSRYWILALRALDIGYWLH